MAIIYEVNLKIAQTIEQEYLSWLKAHIQEMCRQWGFLSATLSQEMMLEQETATNMESRYSVQYKVASMDALKHYFEHNATKVRQEALDRFGSQFSATRRILQPLTGEDHGN